MWLARHGTSIRWARLLAWMFGHVHRAMCSGGCQFEVLQEPACARGEGGGLARDRIIEKMSVPHRLDIFKHGHRAVCSDILSVVSWMFFLARHSTTKEMGPPHHLDV